MTKLTVPPQLIARTLKDPAFRQKMLNDPKAVLASEYNVHLPEHIMVCVLEEAPDTLTIILPLPQEEVVLELADADLAAASGGLGTTGIFCTYSGCPDPR